MSQVCYCPNLATEKTQELAADKRRKNGSEQIINASKSLCAFTFLICSIRVHLWLIFPVRSPFFVSSESRLDHSFTRFSHKQRVRPLLF
jgi:hypothetical protein